MPCSITIEPRNNVASVPSYLFIWTLHVLMQLSLRCENSLTQFIGTPLMKKLKQLLLTSSLIEIGEGREEWGLIRCSDVTWIFSKLHSFTSSQNMRVYSAALLSVHPQSVMYALALLCMSVRLCCAPLCFSLSLLVSLSACLLDRWAPRLDELFLFVL